MLLCIAVGGVKKKKNQKALQIDCSLSTVSQKLPTLLSLLKYLEMLLLSG